MPLCVAGLNRSTRAVLGREWMLHGHLQDRVGMALLLEVADRLTMQDLAITEWAAASPVYTRRLRAAFGIEGDGVDAVFKALQLDVGAPHEFMDFRYVLHDNDHGEFWLAHCGALMDVEPMGEQFVHGMCHAIEDPTFDATAGATNPLVQVRPLHRPPRVPADRVPHCAWRVDVVPAAKAVDRSPLEDQVATSRAAQLPLPSYRDSGDGGLPDSRGHFDPDFVLEDLSGAAQQVALDEFATQSHLLVRAFVLAVTERLGADAAAGMLPRLVRGWCGLTSQRLQRAFDLDATAAGVASLLALHPALAPVSYTDAHIVLEDDQHVRLSLGEGDGDAATWLSRPDRGRLVAGLLQAAVPQVRVHEDGTDLLVVVDTASEPAPPAPEVAVAHFSTGAGFRFGTRPLPGTAVRTTV
ncbi:MAG: hypothetical protein M3P04_11440 [Actinomycetota bacterium]|nr:hypothetical protein [Actinomycetota bacterium]